MNNPFLKEINLKINEKVQKNKELFEKEQIKAKNLFNDFKEHTLVQYEDAKEHLQEHVNHFNSFSENVKNHLAVTFCISSLNGRKYLVIQREDTNERFHIDINLHRNKIKQIEGLQKCSESTKKALMG